MSNQVQNRISVTTNPSFWELFVASLALIRYQGWLIILYSIFPLAGLFLLMTPFMGYRLGAVEILLALLCFSFTPYITAVAVWSTRRRNKLSQGPFTYGFDSEGMHTSSAAFSQTIKWSAIPRVRQSKRFLFVFFTPVRAVCIPLREVNNSEDLERLRILASEHTSFR